MGTINYRSNYDMIEIIVRDSTGRKIEILKCSSKDKGKYRKILKYLKEKYGFSPEISPDEAAGRENFSWWD